MRSPLFISAIELFAHAYELYTQKIEVKFKFIILHLANSVELILKDLVITTGNSIYVENNPNKTIDIWKSLKVLSENKIKIVEKPILELLINDRNNIQHRFGSPNGETVFFYMQCVRDFLQRILKEKYDTFLKDEIESSNFGDLIDLSGFDKTEDNYLEKLNKVSPEMSILQTADDLEKTISKILMPYYSTLTKNTKYGGVTTRPLLPEIEIILFTLVDFKSISNEERLKLLTKYKKFREIRNKIAHGKIEDLKSQDLKTNFKNGVELLSLIRENIEDNVYSIDRIKMVVEKNKRSVDSILNHI